MNQEDFLKLKLSGDAAAYDALPHGYQFTGRPEESVRVTQPVKNRSAGSCDCWIPRDASWSIVPFTGTGCNGCPGVPPLYRNDDSWTPAITIPFNFCFYGQNRTQLHINNNGNISFLTQYPTFTSQPFPTTNFSMVAPFWADVDTRNPVSGLVYYKLTPTYLIVQWDSVGYFDTQADKVNTFQLIISNGSDPIIPGGNNVAFCYKDMQWTTGSASSGVNGFGGIPATAGVNQGNGIEYIQIGRFDQPGYLYDGPYGNPDGISWLDDKAFAFNICSNSNIQPIASGIGFCDTITVCVGDTIFPTAGFLSPEVNQSTFPTATSTLQNFTITNSNAGNSANIETQVIATAADVGFQTITFTGTDNGTPPLSTNVVLVVEVTPGPAANAGSDAYFCGTPVQLNASGGTSYSWSPATGLNDPLIADPIATPAVTTTYVVTVTEGTCAATDTVVVYVGNVNADAGPDASICQGVSAQLNASGGVVYSWDPPTGLSDPDISNPVASPAVTTTYIVTIVNDSCSASDSVTVFVNPSPAAVISSQSDPLCNGQATGSASVNVLQGTPPYSYIWSTTPPQNSNTANGLAAGTYTVTITDATGCSSSQSVTLVDPDPVSVSHSVINPLCNVSNDGSATVSPSGGTPAYSYLWTPGAYTTATVNNLAAGSYSILVTDMNGCSAVDNLVLTEPAALLTSITGTNASCFGSSNGTATVTAGGGTPGYTYLWSNLATGSTISGLSSGTYSVTVSDANGCTSLQTVNITQPDQLELTLISNPACAGTDEGSAMSSASGGSSPYSWIWSTGSTSQTVTGLAPGNYSCTVTDNNGCSETSSVAVLSFPGFTVQVSPDTTIQAGQSVTISASGGNNFIWSPTTGLNCSNCQSPVAHPLSTTTYCVTASDVNGCTGTDCVLIEVNDIICGDVFVPNAFSPEEKGDTRNETVCAYGRCISKIKFEIFSRWGEKVFESNNPDNACWDGIYKGKKMNTGVFVYFLEATLVTGQKISRKGNISLIR